MKTIQRFTISAVAAAMLFGLGGCANMSSQDKSTAVGAGVGAVTGAVLTGGSGIGTVGGQPSAASSATKSVNNARCAMRLIYSVRSTENSMHQMRHD